MISFFFQAGRISTLRVNQGAESPTCDMCSISLFVVREVGFVGYAAVVVVLIPGK